MAELPPLSKRVSALTGQVRPRVLVADDDLADVFATALRTEPGALVTTADNGEAALDLAKAEPFDVWVLNYQMPKRNGVQVLSELRRLQLGTPAIIVTAWPRASVPERTDGLAIEAWLLKPCLPNKLVGAVSDVLTSSTYATRH